VGILNVERSKLAAATIGCIITWVPKPDQGQRPKLVASEGGSNGSTEDVKIYGHNEQNWHCEVTI